MDLQDPHVDLQDPQDPQDPHVASRLPQDRGQSDQDCRSRSVKAEILVINSATKVLVNNNLGEFIQFSLKI